MKDPTLKFLVLLCAVFVFIGASAQDFQPFRMGPSYFFKYNTDFLYVLQVDSGVVENGDSVFYFNTIAHPGGYYPASVYTLGHDNITLRKMIEKSGGQYIFLDSLGDSLVLETQVAVGSSWTCLPGSGGQATLNAKNVQTFAGLTDTVLTIQVPGATLELSQNFGMILMPDLRSLTGNGTTDIYSLWRPPGPAINVDEIYDFDPGDYFGFEGVVMASYPMSKRWTRYEILNRDTSPAGDQFIYQTQREELDVDYWYPDTQYIAPSPVPLTYNRNGSTFLSLPTLAQDNGLIHWETKIQPGPDAGRAELSFTQYFLDTLANSLEVVIDGGNLRQYTSGLGKVFDGTFSIWDDWMELQCYRKATDSIMPCPPFSSLVSRETDASREFSISPNPASENVTLKLLDVGIPKGDYTIQDLTERQVSKGEIKSDEVLIPVGHLSPGTYLFTLWGKVPIRKKLIIQR